MGADMRGKRELAAEVLDLATVIACYDLATCSRLGELQHAPNHAGRAIDLASLLDSGGRGRRGTDDITVADMCGSGVFDAALATAVVEALGM